MSRLATSEAVAASLHYFMAEAFTITNSSEKTKWVQYFYEAKDIVKFSITTAASYQPVSTPVGSINYGILQVTGASSMSETFNSSIMLPSIIYSNIQPATLSVYTGTGGVSPVNNYRFYMDDTNLIVTAPGVITICGVIYILD